MIISKKKFAELEGRLTELEQSSKQQEDKVETLGTILVDLLQKFQVMMETLNELTEQIKNSNNKTKIIKMILQA